MCTNARGSSRVVGSSPQNKRKKFLERESEKRKEHVTFFAEREICEEERESIARDTRGGIFCEWHRDLPLQGRLRMARRAFAFLVLKERSPLFDSFRLLRSVPSSAREEALARRVEC